MGKGGVLAVVVLGLVEVLVGEDVSEGELGGSKAGAEYWHIGATMMRFRSVTPRILRGVKSVGVAGVSSRGAPGVWRCAGVK
jgi:hypothetical protein